MKIWCGFADGLMYLYPFVLCGLNLEFLFLILLFVLDMGGLMINTRRFLMGLIKHGKGDWRNISRNFVVSKTPTQVASHAQKYFARQLSGGKDKRRPSIHDITTVNLTDTTPPENNKSPSLHHSTALQSQQKSTGAPKVILDWDHSNDGALMVFNSTHGNLFMPSPYEVASFGTHHGAHIVPRNPVFQIQSARHQVRGWANRVQKRRAGELMDKEAVSVVPQWIEENSDVMVP